MKKTEAKDYLDDLMFSHKMHRRICLQNEEQGIMVCGHDYVQIYGGIEILAKAAEIPLTLKDRNDENFRYEHSFVYGGVMFLQVCGFDELPEVVWDED